MTHSAISAAAASSASSSQSSPPCCSGLIEALLSRGLEDPPPPEFRWVPPRRDSRTCRRTAERWRTPRATCSRSVRVDLLTPAGSPSGQQPSEPTTARSRNGPLRTRSVAQRPLGARPYLPAGGSCAECALPDDGCSHASVRVPCAGPGRCSGGELATRGSPLGARRAGADGGWTAGRAYGVGPPRLQRARRVDRAQRRST